MTKTTTFLLLGAAAIGGYLYLKKRTPAPAPTVTPEIQAAIRKEMGLPPIPFQSGPAGFIQQAATAALTPVAMGPLNGLGSFFDQIKAAARFAKDVSITPFDPTRKHLRQVGQDLHQLPGTRNVPLIGMLKAKPMSAPGATPDTSTDGSAGADASSNFTPGTSAPSSGFHPLVVVGTALAVPALFLGLGKG